MGLYNRAYLVMQESQALDDPSEAVFELRYTDYTESVAKSYVMGQRAQYLREFESFVGDDVPFTVLGDDLLRRTGYWHDGGTGQWSYSLEFEIGLDHLRWGDSESPTGPDSVTATDASGEGVRPVSRIQVLNYWTAQTRSDSFCHTRLHVGEHTDGRFDDYVDGEYVNIGPGEYGSPIPIAISEEITMSKDKATTSTGTLNAVRVSPWPGTEGELALWAFEQLGTALTGGIGTIPDA